MSYPPEPVISDRLKAVLVVYFAGCVVGAALTYLVMVWLGG